MPDKQETPALDHFTELAEVLSSSDHLTPLVLQHPSKAQAGLQSFTKEKEGGV